MPDALYVNGRFTTTDERVIGVEDRGFQFGDGIYEVFKFVKRRPVFLEEHYRRFEEGLAALEIASPWTLDSFQTVIAELLERTAFEDGIVYIQITRGECERSHFAPTGLAPTVIAYSRSFRFPDAAKKENGISVITARDLRWGRCDLKTLNLLGNYMGRREAKRAGADEALLIRNHTVTEGATSSFFAVLGRRIVTHPNGSEILPGTVRDQVVTLALQAGIRVDERPLRDDELYWLDEAFITSTTQGVMPVVRIDGRTVATGTRGPITHDLQQRLDALEHAAANHATP
jgi:D-alanine transaminase